MAIVLGSKRKTFANENFAELDDFSEMTKTKPDRQQCARFRK